MPCLNKSFSKGQSRQNKLMKLETNGSLIVDQNLIKNKSRKDNSLRKKRQNSKLSHKEQIKFRKMEQFYSGRQSVILNYKSTTNQVQLSRKFGDSKPMIQSYYISNAHNKRAASASRKSRKSQKSKQFSTNSHIFNNTFEMQSPMAGHRQKKSVFSSTICSKYEQGAAGMNQFQLNKSSDSFAEIMVRTKNVLENYKLKCDNLEKQNKKYKKKYSDALKKIKGLEIKL